MQILVNVFSLENIDQKVSIIAPFYLLQQEYTIPVLFMKNTYTDPKQYKDIHYTGDSDNI